MASASRNTAVPIALAAAALALSACGGGGSGGSVTAGPPVTLDWQADRPAVLAANRARVLGAVAAAAAARPRAGGLTRSGNRGDDGLTTDHARIAFDGRRPSLAVTRADGRRVALTAADHASPVAEFRRSRFHDHASGGWASLRVTDDSISVSRFVVSWNAYDPADYLAGASWLHFSDLGEPEGPTFEHVEVGPDVERHVSGLSDPAGLLFEHVEVGAVVDGPELSAEFHMPPTGLASYSGPVHGYFAIEGAAAAGGDPLSARGSIELGSFAATIDLYASFHGEAPFIHGCIACGAPMRFHSLAVDAESGLASPLAESYGEYDVEFDLTPLAPDGTFGGSGVSVRAYGSHVSESAGSWGGRLSSVQDSEGEPRSAAGTFGATFATDDRRRGAFAGMFVGWEPSSLVIE